MNAIQQKRLAAWDQLEASWRERFANCSNEELYAMGNEVANGLPSLIATAMLPTALVALGFGIAYEIQAREGGFGREPFNPCEEMTP